MAEQTMEEIIMLQFSRLVGKLLTAAEAAIPGDRQCESFKKIIEEHVYNSRNDVLRLVTGVDVSTRHSKVFQHVQQEKK